MNLDRRTGYVKVSPAPQELELCGTFLRFRLTHVLSLAS